MTRAVSLMLAAALCLAWTSTAHATRYGIYNESDTLVYAFAHTGGNRMRGDWLLPGQAIGADYDMSQGTYLWVIIPDLHGGYANVQRWQYGGATFDIPYGRIFYLTGVCGFTDGRNTANFIGHAGSRIDRTWGTDYTIQTSAGNCLSAHGVVNGGSPPASNFLGSKWQMTFGVRQPDGRVVIQQSNGRDVPSQPARGAFAIKLVTRNCDASQTKYCAVTNAPVYVAGTGYFRTITTDAGGVLHLDAGITQAIGPNLYLDFGNPSHYNCSANVPRNLAPGATLTLGCSKPIPIDPGRRHWRWAR